MRPLNGGQAALELVLSLREMADAGIRRVAAFVTSAFSSYSGCRQYRENIAAACAEAGPGTPQIDKLRMFYNHPGFIEPMIERVDAALQQIPAERRAQLTSTAARAAVRPAQDRQRRP